MAQLTKKTKIALTGGAGYIGSFTTKYLKDLGFENLVILDNFSTGHKDKCFARFYEVDLLDKQKLDDIFVKEQFEAVIHFAALIVVPHSMQDPHRYFSHNVNTSLNLLEAMKKTNVKNIVFSSTCAVYGTPQKLPIAEDEPIKPESVYAETKTMIETMIGWYKKLYGFNYALLRYFNACGAAKNSLNGELHNPETHIIPSVIYNLLARIPIEIYGKDYPTPDGTCVRDYIHVEDLASAHHLAIKYIMENNTSDVFNLGIGRGNSNIEVVNAILEEAKTHGIEGKIEFKDRRPGDVPELYADNAKARRVLGWNPTHTDIKGIVKDALNFHLKQR